MGGVFRADLLLLCVCLPFRKDHQGKSLWYSVHLAMSHPRDAWNESVQIKWSYRKTRKDVAAVEKKEKEIKEDIVKDTAVFTYCQGTEWVLRGVG